MTRFAIFNSDGQIDTDPSWVCSPDPDPVSFFTQNFHNGDRFFIVLKNGDIASLAESHDTAATSFKTDKDKNIIVIAFDEGSVPHSKADTKTKVLAAFHRVCAPAP